MSLKRAYTGPSQVELSAEDREMMADGSFFTQFEIAKSRAGYSKIPDDQTRLAHLTAIYQEHHGANIALPAPL